jgi:sugar phosphate isomerase/epimerase
MNKIAEKAKPEGMLVGYHNHSADFRRIDGEFGWDIFYRATVPEVVMQIDTGNAMYGEATADDVLKVMKRYQGRAVTVHLKEYSSTNDKALIGEGDMKWKEFFGLCETIGGTEWYIVEQESYAFPPLECIKRCLENLRTLL